MKTYTWKEVVIESLLLLGLSPTMLLAIMAGAFLFGYFGG